MKAKVYTITPELATEWLEKNKANRPASSRIVNRYAEEMKAGRWQLNGEPIIFSTTSDLLDGQHRLWAVVESKTTIQSLVVFDVDPAAFVSMNSGKTRGPSDVLYISGIRSDASRIAAAAKWCVLYKTTNVYAGKHVPKYDILSYVNANPDLIPLVKKMTNANRGNPIARISAVICATAYIGAHTYKDAAADFVATLLSGAGLEVGDPRLALRNRFLSEEREDAATRFALAAMAWNAWIENRKLSKVQIPRADQFPRIKGANEKN